MLVDGGDERVGVVVEERHDLFRRRRFGDAREVPEVAEPQHGLDPVGHAAGDAPFSTRRPASRPR